MIQGILESLHVRIEDNLVELQIQYQIAGEAEWQRLRVVLSPAESVRVGREVCSLLETVLDLKPDSGGKNFSWNPSKS